MRDLRKISTVAGAFAAGGLVGFVMWLVARQQLPEPLPSGPDTAAVSPVREPVSRDEEEAREEQEAPDGAEDEGEREEAAEPDEAAEAQERAPTEEPPASVASPEVAPAPVPTPGPTPVPALNSRPLPPSWRVPGAPFRQIVEVALVPIPTPPGGRGRRRAKDEPAHEPMPEPAVARSTLALGEVGSPPPAGKHDALPARGGLPPPRGDVASARVFDSGGTEVRSRLVARPDGGAVYDLYFDAKKVDAGERFEVYYPAPGERDAPGRLAEGEAGPFPDGDLLVTVYRVDPGRVRGRGRLRRLRDIARAMQGAKPLGPPRRQTHIDDRESPYGPNDHYAAVYQSYLACPKTGSYEFGIDADDLAVLIVDGKEILTGGRPGKLPDRPFPYRTQRSLKAGLRAITLYHVQSTEALRARLAWKPAGGGAFRVIPPSAFVSHIQARPVALELRDREGPNAFFRAEPLRRLVVNRTVPVTLWRLIGPPVPGDLAGAVRRAHDARVLSSSKGAGAGWVWREGGRKLGEGGELQVYCSGLREPGAERPYREITLALETAQRRDLQMLPRGGDNVVVPTAPRRLDNVVDPTRPGIAAAQASLSRYTRRLGALDAPPEEAERLTLRLELASAPNFIYPHERAKLVLRAINDSAEPVSLEAVERRWKADPAVGDGSIHSRSLGLFELPAVGPEDADVLARRMNVVSLDLAPEEYAPLGRLVYLLGPPRAPAVRLAIDLLPSRERVLPGLRAECGRFLADSGARALFVVPYDREVDRRRFAFLKRLMRGSGDSRKALLYGEDLSSSGARGGEGLAPRMRAGLGSRVELRHVPFPEGSYPIDAAVAGVDAALLEADWGRIWISVGTLDVRTGTPVREFRRGLDCLIDRVRTLRSGARLVIVGPPPEWSREDVSRRYAEAAREVAKQHHLPLAELHELVMDLAKKLAERAPAALRRAQDGGTELVEGAAAGSPWREDTDSAASSGPSNGPDRVYFPYPVGGAMDEIAREVLRH